MTEQASIDDLLSASAPAAWERYSRNLPKTQTYMSRIAFRAGFDAGISFARLASDVKHGGGEGNDDGAD